MEPLSWQIRLENHNRLFYSSSATSEQYRGFICRIMCALYIWQSSPLSGKSVFQGGENQIWRQLTFPTFHVKADI